MNDTAEMIKGELTARHVFGVNDFWQSGHCSIQAMSIYAEWLLERHTIIDDQFNRESLLQDRALECLLLDCNLQLYSPRLQYSKPRTVQTIGDGATDAYMRLGPNERRINDPDF